MEKRDEPVQQSLAHLMDPLGRSVLQDRGRDDRIDPSHLGVGIVAQQR